MTTHKAYTATSAGVWVELDKATLEPGVGQVLVQVAYTGLIPVDVEAGDRALLGPDAFPYVPGFTVAGTVAKLGEGVDASLYDVGDKVLGYPIPSYGPTAKGAQEYAVLPYYAVGKLPDNIALDDAATVIDNFVCAWLTVKTHIGIPLPNKAPSPDSAVLVYGASSTTGQFIIQLLVLAGLKRIIAVSSAAHHEHLKALGAAHTVDYRQPNWPQLVLAANGGPVPYAVDIIATEASLRGVAETVTPQSKVAVLFPIKLNQDRIVASTTETNAQLAWGIPQDKNPFPAGLEVEFVRTFMWEQDESLKSNLITKIFPELLQSGVIRPVAKKVISSPEDSLAARVQSGLELLRNNSVSGYKVIIKV